MQRSLFRNGQAGHGLAPALNFRVVITMLRTGPDRFVANFEVGKAKTGTGSLFRKEASAVVREVCPPRAAKGAAVAVARRPEVKPDDWTEF